MPTGKQKTATIAFAYQTFPGPKTCCGLSCQIVPSSLSRTGPGGQWSVSGRPSSGRFLAPSKAQSPMKTAPARSRAEDKFSYTEICDRYGADKRSRNSALLASYLAAARLPSEPSMTVLPSVVDTYHLHFRPRLFTTTSKTGNRNSIAQASYGTRTPISATNMPAKSTFEEDQPINEII